MNIALRTCSGPTGSKLAPSLVSPATFESYPRQRTRVFDGAQGWAAGTAGRERSGRVTTMWRLGRRATKVLQRPGTFALAVLKGFRANQGVLLAGAVAY